MNRLSETAEDQTIFLHRYILNLTVAARSTSNAGSLFTISEAIHVAAGWLWAQDAGYSDRRSMNEIVGHMLSATSIARGQAIDEGTDPSLLLLALEQTLNERPA